MRHMFGFLIKKWFFDLWDNFLPSILINLGFILLLAIPVAAAPAAANAGILSGILVQIAGILLVVIYLGGVYTAAKSFTNYSSISIGEIWTGLRETLPLSLIFGLILLFHAFLLSVALPFYSSFGNWVGLLALSLLFWMSVTWLLAAQYLYPTHRRLNREIRQVFKKSFLLFFDNILFSVVLALGAVIIGAISVFTAFLIPGISGIAIWYEAALKLRMYKYDHLEEHPDERKSIPWDSLLYDERERVGKRTLRGMIFPWKE